MKIKKKIYFLAILAIFLANTGCVKTVEEQGYATNFSELANVEGSVQTKEQVRKLLGSPSTISTFGKETWYYIRSKTEHVAFLKPDAIEQDILSLTFDADGNIEKIDIYGLKDGRRIEFAEEKTPTEGNELSITEQLLGNLGKFNPNQ
jgi:outer membrane protein assembly factor BamE (lipoprotein component of BamABCDE complex)